ncbi:MAG: CRISPR-associated endonuclease Cas1, partial [Bacteroidales bacterium]|nr:CRISPR-associated endonuclease Cas1 [Bacteroidales bacterium]
AALDAGSKFIYGILLRWILFHKLSPCHAYLHEPTDYPSLVYDLIEPYRYMIEQAVFSCYIADNKVDEKTLVAKSLEMLKSILDETIYVPASRQYVKRKNLLHGIVLALRSYLLGESKRFVIPVEGDKKGGRPPKIAYRLPGER